MHAEAALDAQTPRPDGWRDLLGEGRAPVLALILLGCWVVAADSLVTATIMPSVGADLSGYAWFGWAAAGFMTGLVVAGAAAGWLAERIGLRGAMMLAGAAFALGCGLSAAAPDIALFLAGRVLQGCAAGLDLLSDLRRFGPALPGPLPAARVRPLHQHLGHRHFRRAAARRGLRRRRLVAGRLLAVRRSGFALHRRQLRADPGAHGASTRTRRLPRPYPSPCSRPASPPSPPPASS